MPPVQPVTHLEVVTEILGVGPVLVLPDTTLTLIAGLRSRTDSLAIVDDVSAAVAAQLLIEAQATAKAIEARREEVKAPFLEAGRKIDSVVKLPKEELERTRQAISRKLNAWQEQQAKLAREAEAKRQEELRRLEEQRKRAAEEARRAEQAAAASDDPFSGEAVVEQAQASQAKITEAVANLQSARAIVPSKPAGITYRTTLKYTVNDVRLLPSSLVTLSPNDAAIRAVYCTGWRENNPVPSVPGITFTVDKQPVVSSRR